MIAMRVLCVNGHEGVLNEGEIYFVSEVTDNGNFMLFDVDPPSPYLCFNKNRFVLLDEPTEEDMIEMFGEEFKESNKN